MADDFQWGLFGSSWEDPKTMMMMQMAAGLLGGNPSARTAPRSASRSRAACSVACRATSRVCR